MPLSFIHRYEPATADAPPLLLLHGTGGDENDLLALGRAVAPGSALVSPRGKVSENGMPRFFRRLAEGVFDEADLRRRTGDLAAFIGAAQDRYGLGAPLALGFSNGANIAANAAHQGGRGEELVTADVHDAADLVDLQPDHAGAAVRDEHERLLAPLRNAGI